MPLLPPVMTATLPLSFTNVLPMRAIIGRCDVRNGSARGETTRVRRGVGTRNARLAEPPALWPANAIAADEVGSIRFEPQSFCQTVVELHNWIERVMHSRAIALHGSADSPRRRRGVDRNPLRSKRQPLVAKGAAPAYLASADPPWRCQARVLSSVWISSRLSAVRMVEAPAYVRGSIPEIFFRRL